MSSELAEDLLNVLDAASDLATVVAASKPVARGITNLLPSTVLKRGDEYLDSTLKLLEASKPIMPEHIHDAHHLRYDDLQGIRKGLRVKTLSESFQRYPQIRQFKKDAKVLHHDMRTSSQEIRSARLWSPNRSASTGSMNNRLDASLEEDIVGEEQQEDGNSTQLQSVTGIHHDVVEACSTRALSLSDPFRETDSVIVRDDNTDDVSVYSTE